MTCDFSSRQVILSDTEQCDTGLSKSMRKIACLLAMSTALSTGIGGFAWAASTDVKEPVYDASENSIEEIEITATRSSLDAQEFPGSISVIKRDAIDDFLASSIADIFRTLPNIQFSGGPRRGGEVPSIRGASGAGVLVLFDGVRQNFLSAHDGRFFIDPSLLRRADVVRGSAGNLFGSGSLGGVLAFETLNASDLIGDSEADSAYRLAAQYQGVNNEFASTATVATTGFDGKLDAVGSVTYRNSGDISLADGNSLTSDDEIGSALAKLSYQASDALRLSAQWIGYRGDAREPNNGQGLLEGDLVDKDVTVDTLRFGARFNPVDQDLIDAKLIAYYTDSSVDEAELDTDREIVRAQETYGFSFENRSLWQFNEVSSLSLNLGGEYFSDQQKGTDNTTADGTRGGVPNASSDTFGAFAQAELKLDTGAGQLLVVPSIRYDDFNTESDDDPSLDNDLTSWNPRLGISYQPVDGVQVFGSWGESFRAPSFNEIFANGIHFQIPLGPFVQAPNFFVPNADLQPESADTFEAGIGLDFADVAADGDRLTVKGTWFQSDVNNLIDLAVDVAFSPSCFSPMVPGPCTSGTSQNVNTTRARLDGIEIEANYISDRVNLALAYASIDGVNRDTDAFVGILTPNRLTAVGSYAITEIDLRLGARAEFAASFNEVNDPADGRESYEVLDLFLVYAPSEGPLEGLRLDLGVDNVFDTLIERVFAGVPDPGRNWKASIAWTGRF